MTTQDWQIIVAAAGQIAGVAVPGGGLLASLSSALTLAVMQGVADAGRKGEMTPEQVTAFTNELLAAVNSDAFKTDAELAAGKPPVDTAPGNG
jgi:hypothetical protein